jgi:hypothetical protein
LRHRAFLTNLHLRGRIKDRKNVDKDMQSNFQELKNLKQKIKNKGKKERKGK